MGRSKADQQQEVMSYAEMVEAEFLRLYRKYDVANAPEKRKSEIVDSFWKDIYTSVFKADRGQMNNYKTKLMPWDIVQVEAVCDMYVQLCKRYGGVIKYNQFCNLTGYNRNTLDLWHKANINGADTFAIGATEEEQEYYQNSCVYVSNVDEIKEINWKRVKGLSLTRYDVKKKLQSEMWDSNTNGLSNDTMGAAIRANNDTEIGKLYEPKRMIQREQIRQALTADQLPTLELSENHTQFIEQSS